MPELQWLSDSGLNPSWGWYSIFLSLITKLDHRYYRLRNGQSNSQRAHRGGLERAFYTCSYTGMASHQSDHVRCCVQAYFRVWEWDLKVERKCELVERLEWNTYTCSIQAFQPTHISTSNWNCKNASLWPGLNPSNACLHFPLPSPPKNSMAMLYWPYQWRQPWCYRHWRKCTQRENRSFTLVEFWNVYDTRNLQMTILCVKPYTTYWSCCHWVVQSSIGS